MWSQDFVLRRASRRGIDLSSMIDRFKAGISSLALCRFLLSLVHGFMWWIRLLFLISYLLVAFLLDTYAWSLRCPSYIIYSLYSWFLLCCDYACRVCIVGIVEWLDLSRWFMHIMWIVCSLVCVLGVIMLTVHLHVVCTYVFVMYFWRSCVDCMFVVYTHVWCVYYWRIHVDCTYVLCICVQWDYWRFLVDYTCVVVYMCLVGCVDLSWRLYSCCGVLMWS